MKVRTLGIRLFLKNFSDEQLAALYAHTQDMKLSFNSCCCLVGSITADHPLKGFIASWYLREHDDTGHYHDAFKYSYAYKAEEEFEDLANTDIERCKRLLPILDDEIRARETKKQVKTDIAEMGVSA